MKKHSDETLSSLDLKDIIGTINNMIAKCLNIRISKVLLNGENNLSIFDHQGIKTLSPHQAPEIYNESLSSSQTIVRNNITLESPETIKLYCSMPILSKRGETLGAIIAIDNQKDSLNPTEIILFENTAQMAALILEKHFETQKIKKVLLLFVSFCFICVFSTAIKSLFNYQETINAPTLPRQ